MKTYGYDPISLGLEVGNEMGDYCLCICPFHSDSKPSMAFYLETGTFYCFACGEYGDVNKLQNELGGEVVRKDYIIQHKRSNGKNDIWRDLLKLPNNHYDQYLSERGLTVDQIIKFDIRSDDEKIVVPFFDSVGDIVGLKMRWKQARGKAKYMNFGEQPHIFGDDNLNRDVVVVVEGLFGYFLFNKHNIPCISLLSANHVYGYDDIFSLFPDTLFKIMFDPDNSGIYGAIKLLILNRGNNNVVVMEDFYDVDKMSRHHFESVRDSLEFTKEPFSLIEKFGTIEDRKFYGKLVKKFAKKVL